MEAWWPQIELPRPEWLAALLVLPLLIRAGRRSLAGLAPRRQAASLFCRGAVVVALVLALGGVRVVKPSSRKFVVFAVDHSLSIAQESRRKADAFLDEAQKTLGENRAAVLPFGRRPGAIRRDRSSGAVELDPRGTNLAAAIGAAGVAIPPGYVPQVVLLSDGNETAGDALEAVGTVHTPISTVPLASAADPEVYVSALETKGQVRLGDPLDVDVVIHASGDDEGTVQLLRDGQPVERRRIQVTGGTNRVRFVQSLGEQGWATFTARIDGFRDTLVQNNVGSVPVFTTARPRVLVVESGSRPASRLAAALENEQIEVEGRRAEDFPASAVDLDRYDAVVLSNVPAAAIGRQMEAIRGYVRDFGGGLIVIGGDQAFTAGGYHQTMLEEILPVSCVADREQPRPSVALVLVVDRSGSMEGEAIELAKEATRRAVRMLGAADQVGVMAFEDNSRWVVPIQPCNDKDRVMAEIDTITAGGGTDLYAAIQKAYLALDEAFAQVKHMIVLTDGASHPGDFEALLAEIAEAGITVSTVAVGREAVAGLLEDIARIGRGHYYYCDDPAAVPEIFARETAAAGKVGLVQRPFFPQPVDPDPVLAGLDLQQAPSLLGYVQTRAKPAARTALASEQGDPLLVWWRYGRGMAVAFTSDVHPRWAAPWLRWPGFERFWSLVARHAMRGNQAEDFVFTVQRDHQRVEVTLETVDRAGNYLNGVEATLHVVDPEGNHRQMAVKQVAPGRYAADFSAHWPGTYYLEVQAKRGGRLVYTAHRGLAVCWPDELRTRPANRDLLKKIAHDSGGSYDPKPSAVFAPSAETVPRTTPVWPALLAAALVLLVVDVGIRRLV